MEPANVKSNCWLTENVEILLRVLREQLGLTGAKEGCENGDCGACTVVVGRLPIKSCLMLAIEAIGTSVITIEALRDTPIQQAFVDKFAFQCGFCTPGFLMVCHSLTNVHPNASEEVIREWLQSNICRCTSYEEIRAAVQSVISKP
jgi:carbon-monoxide dehydrogenase small subunit